MPKLQTNFQKAEDSPGFLLWKASNLLQRMHSRCLSDLSVTPTQFSLMTCLVYLYQDGPVTAARIVEHAGMDKMMVSDLIKTLAGKKLVKRKANLRDGRSFLLEPTPRGVDITNSAVGKIEVLDAEFFKKVKDTRSFQEDLMALLR